MSLVAGKNEAPLSVRDTKWALMFFPSLQFPWISPSWSTRPMCHENTSFFILPIFLNLNVLAMCPCPVWVCEHMRQVLSTFGRMQEFTGVWVRDPRIQKEDFWHAYMDYEICIHVSAIEIYRGHKGYNVIKQKGKNSLIILYISCLLRQTVWLSLRRAPVCGGDTASLCG